MSLCPMQDASEYFELFVTSYKGRDFMSKLLFLASPGSSAEAEWLGTGSEPQPPPGPPGRRGTLSSHKGATQASTVLGPLCVCCPVLPGPSSLPQALLTLRPDQLLPGFRAGSQGPAEAGAGPIGALWPVGGFVGSVFLHSRGNSDLRLSGSPGPMSLCVSG